MVIEKLGGYLCLDAVNTEMIVDGDPVDLWSDFDSLLGWLSEANLFTPHVVSIIAEWPVGMKAAVLKAARELRETLRILCEEVEATKTVSDEVLEQLNAFLERRAVFEELERVDDKIMLRRWVNINSLDILVPIAGSAARLLSEGDLSLLKKCSNPACILWFYDSTKNKRRRWCSMATCGNRHKAAAHYARHKNEDPLSED